MNQFGTYYPVQSFWHAIDPRTKIITAIVFMVAAFLLKSWAVFLLFVIVVLIYSTAKLPFWILGEILIKFKWLLIVTFIVNLFLPFSNLSYLVQLSFPHAVIITARLGIILTIAFWVNLTTKPAVLVDGLIKLFKPLSWFKIPLGELTLIMSLTLRFIPEMLVESENIMMAQKIRGISPKISLRNVNIWAKSFFIPLCLAGIRRSAAMAVAMSIRGYRPGKSRSSTEVLVLRMADVLVIGVSCLFLLCCIGWSLLN
jgi:energy-coupling factor transport system permease protein